MPVEDQLKDELGVWVVTDGDCVAAGGMVALRLELVTPGAEDDPSADKRTVALFLSSETATDVAHHLLAVADALPSDRRQKH